MEEVAKGERMLYVPVCGQTIAREMGARFVRKSFFSKESGYFFIPSGLCEEKASYLRKAYGVESYDAKQRESKLLSEWRDVIKNKDKFECLRMAKTFGFPKDDSVMESLLLKLNDRREGEYPVSWEHLREYIPSFDEEFGVERYSFLHREYDLQGDMERAIKESSMPSLDKAYLMFAYEIN